MMPDELTLDELKRLADSVGELRGWDFTRVRDARDPVPWDYAEVVSRYVRPTDHVLDIGTGGGERFLALAPRFGSGIGIDANPGMVRTSQENTPPSLVDRISFERMDAADLGFPDVSFDVVLNRHAGVYATEVARVLRPGGYFITQQVGRQNTLNVLAAFGWEPDSFGDGWWQEMSDLAGQFGRNGCTVVARAEYNVRTWYLDVESFIFWLKAVPLPEELDLDKHWRAVNRVLTEHRTAQGIETNEHRELLIVQKR
jgi:SAM-dependent methyltransferase